MRTKELFWFLGIATLVAAFSAVMIHTKPANAAESQRKPRILIIFDTSGSMAWDDGGASTEGDGSNDPWTDGGNCCQGTGGSRIYTAKEALRKMVLASGEIEFGLLTFPQTYYPAGGRALNYYSGNQGAGDDSMRWDYGPDSGCDYAACDLDSDCHYLRVAFGGPDEAKNNPAEIAMWMDHHEYSRTEPYGVPDPNPLADWLDGPGLGTEQEIRAEGATPIASSLDAAHSYLLAQKGNDNTYVQGCRPYSVILVADGDQSAGCGLPDPAVEAGQLFGDGFKVWAINFIGGNPALMDSIASNGGTTAAFSASNETELRDALFQIVSETIQIETCNDTANPTGPAWDEDCDCPGNGAGAGDTNLDGTECGPGDDGVNEGFTLFCDQQNAPVGYESELRYCADPGETVCDGLDDNCDGTTDVPPPTGWPAGSGVGDDCYDPSDSGCTGPPGACTGACQFGSYACESGGLICSGDIHPAPVEQCDGVDEDCDGLIDDADDLNEYSVTGAVNCGICGDGEERCVNYVTYATMECCATTSAFGFCDPVQVPVDEICNGADDNCNGANDEGNPEGGIACFPTPEYTGCNLDGSGCIGECLAGATVCSFGCTAGMDLCIGDFVCQNATLPAAEVCDGLDNDCDGDPTDDGAAELNLGQTCPSDTHPTLGECVAGKWECQTGSMVCEPDSGTEIVYPTAEICDGLDNDCDGVTDEDLFQACGGCDPLVEVDCTGDPNEGLCQQGIQYCDPDNAMPAGLGGPAWLACTNSITPVAEECNRLDDDCDGVLDDGLADEGPCEGADPFGCPGYVGDQCPDAREQGDCVSGDLFCNGSGQLECGGSPVNPVPETCNGTDEDCDGSTDENLWQECFTGSQGCAGDPLVCQGICQPGQQTCNTGGWGTWDGPLWQPLGCGGQIIPALETCNDLDDDCDGTTDNNLTDPWLGTACGKGVCTGTYVCGPLGTQDCNMPVQPGTQAEVCDGLDNDCDGHTDEGLFQECWTEAYAVTGICHHGVQQCVFLTGDPGDSNYPWGECQGEVTPADQEACNGLDDDCDGATDEEDMGLVSPWHEICNVCDDIWECVAGELVCEIADPQPEICDGEDNDCDGITDEVTEDCGGCLSSLYPECEDGQDPNAGVCRQGTRQCTWVAGFPDDDINWSDCAGDVGPSNEICDGLDNDCDCEADTWGDGILCNHLDDFVDEEDEIWPSGLVPCMDAVGECQAAVLRCVVDTDSNVEIACCASVNPLDGTCVPPQGPDTETCDGLDNDCDGLTDEGLTVACGGCDPGMYPGFDCLQGAEEGECKQGMSTCVFVEDPGLHPDWPWSDCLGDTGPTLESCNLLDDDCDGVTDNGVVFNPPDCGLTATDNFGEGECEPGVWICNTDGNAECDGAIGPTIEICDGLDNDCDAETDEELPESGLPCGSDIGLCEYGENECVELKPGVWDFDCIGETEEQKEVCDGFDNDCDNQTDEELGFGATCTNSPTKAPEGECDEGLEECINGRWECNANWPSPEICDGLDNDCDGDTDENLEVDCPKNSICIQGECADECSAEELSCPMGDSCEQLQDETGNDVWVCISAVCDPGHKEALDCVFNPYWCDEDWDPKCVCDAARKECVNICEHVDCPQGKVCIPSDGTCQFLQDDCWTQGCVTGMICVGGKCVDDPCADVICKGTEYCNDVGDCVDGCTLDQCPEGQGCFEGECTKNLCHGVSCNPNEDCDPKTGDCIDDGPCAKVDCQFYEVCVDGECIDDPCWNIECPNGLQCIMGACYEYDASSGGDGDADSDADADSDNDSDSDGDTSDTSDTATGPQMGDEVLNDVLATGVGGCLCTTTPGSTGHNSTGALLFMLGMVAMILRLARRRVKGTVLTLSIGVLALLLTACQTQPYDFGGDPEGGTSGDGDGDSDADSDSDNDSDNDSDTDECNTEDEDLCDNIDNDCDGETDEDVDMTSDPSNCGECDNVCEYPNAVGLCVNSVCEMGNCAVFWWDENSSDKDGCEYYCQPTATDDFCDGVDLGDGSYVPKDNNCDGNFDEDVDFESDPLNCGLCMHVCRYLNAEALCTKGVCNMGICDDNYFDIDKEWDNGCEYHCVPDGKGEICDGKDNDCDGDVDEDDNDPKSEYGAEGGGACYTAASGCDDNGGKFTCYGECRTGVLHCESSELRCKNEVNPVSETCNNLDDDCDDVVDDEEDIPLLGTDGSLCGNSTGECEQGNMRCAKADLSADFSELCCDSVDGDRVCAPPVQPVEIEGLLPGHCDGNDNDCDGFIDEDPNDPNQTMTTSDPCYYGQIYGQPPGVQLGECAINTGVWTCFWGTFLCEGAKGSKPETCDGLDNDCDGVVDEDLYQDCPDPGFLDSGICRWGQQKCQNATWGWGEGAGFVPDACGNQIVPRDETCNTLDDDCDGETDELGDLLIHDARIDIPCGQGYCAGVTSCEVGQIECGGPDPIAESPCDLVDNDCNGVTDEWATYTCGGCDVDYGVLIGADPADYANCIEGQPSLGQCQLGTWLCEDTNGDDILEQVCMGTILPKAEICNGEDDDCDGVEDNNPTDVGDDCTVGICPGTTICNASAQTVCDFPGTAPGDVAETCNNQDDDCDGFVDENLSQGCGGCETAYCLTAGPGGTHDRGVGECKAGIEICDGAGSWGACNGSIMPIAETCDNKDNDCDGAVDEQADGTPLTGSNCGPPCDDGVLTCVAGIWQCQGATVPSDDLCNTLDDDCNANTPDGTAEDWYFTPCDSPDDSDLCEEGVWQCVAGVKTCSDGTGDSVETCDTVDNDCDGVTDLDIDPADVPAWVCDGDCAGIMTPECNNGNWRCEYDCAQVECQNDPYGPPVAMETLCDGEDGDCDGIVDDDFSLDSNVLHCGACDNACGTAPGNTLTNVAVYYCGDHLGSTQCLPLTCATAGLYTAVDLDNDPTNGCECMPTADADIPCNAVDEDCDGVVDMGTTEVCDGIDNDCDNLTDLDDPDLQAAIPSWVCNDNCPGGVTETCVDTGGGVFDWVCDYSDDVTVGAGGQPTTGPETLCDGIDNDCDSLVDDGIAGLRETCTETYNAFCSESGAGGCDPADAANPVLCCRGIDSDNICTDEIVFSGTDVEGAVPNNVDEDCDGLTDEGTACADSEYLKVTTPGGDTFDMFTYEASMYDATALSDGSAAGSVPCSRLNTLPWTMVNYSEARDACRRLNAGFEDETDCLAGDGCWDLCTEEQWQFACASGTPPAGNQDLNPLLFPYGDYYEDQTCNGLDYAAPFENVEQTGTLAGCFAEYGVSDLFDMSGNVEEWTRTPREGAATALHVIRGGSFNDLSGGMTCTFDMSAGADSGGVEFRMSNLGFRCCRARKTGTCGPQIEVWNTTDPDLGETACAADQWCPGGQCETCDQDQACWDGVSCESCPPYYRCGGYGLGCVLCDQDTACEANCLNCADVDPTSTCVTHGVDGDPQVWSECQIPPTCAETVVSFDYGFEGPGCDDQGWTLNGDWDVGTDTNPVPDTGACHIGQRMGADYRKNRNDNADSPSFDLAVCVGETVNLTFRLWYEIELTNDNLYLDIFSGGSWTTAVRTYTGLGGTPWATETLDVSAYMAADFQIRFRFVSNGNVQERGPYIDQVQLTAP